MKDFLPKNQTSLNFALQKTLELLAIIGIGLLMQRKVAKADLKGLKTVILSLALPSVIFVALLKIKLDANLLVLPIMALVFNLVMLLTSKVLLPLTFDKKESAKKRTAMMLLPSLAPGLSCFPFIVVYLNDDILALAALADVGNKIFGLILLYLLAMQWYHSRKDDLAAVQGNGKLKSLLLSLVNEPINIVIVLGLVLLSFGVTFEAFPVFLQNVISNIKVLMTPLVLLFIGMAVRIKFKEFALILSLLLRRAGLTLAFSALVLFLLPNLAVAMAFLVVVFPQSACSFWPFAHMSAVDALEVKDGKNDKTFDLDLAINVLACSLPFSTILIISIFSVGEFFIDPKNLLLVAILFIGLSFVKKARTILSNILKKKRSMNELSEPL